MRTRRCGGGGLAPSFGVAIDEPFPLSQGASEEDRERAGA